jgi:2-C-methyl-D-erythritol 4-phosphate cytidylyltransferase
MNYALIFSGGVGRRMDYSSDIPKQFLQIGGQTILARTIKKFQNHDKIDGIVVVCVGTHIAACHDEISRHGLSKVIDVVEGGTTAQKSILIGLRRLKEVSSANTTVLIHDGVRPIIGDRLISKNIETVEKSGSAVSIVPCSETILFRSNQGGDGYKALVRQDCVIARAPQCYKIDDVLPAAEAAFKGNLAFVDTYSLMETYGISAVPVECDPSNIKITTYSDFLTAKILIEEGI